MQRRAVGCVLLPGLLMAGPAFGAVRAVFVLDRSGSMSEVESGLRATGHSRCLDAWLTMKTDMADFFTAHPSGTAAVVYFGEHYGGVVNVTQTMFGSDFVGPAQATGALNSLDPNTTGDCGGSQ